MPNPPNNNDLQREKVRFLNNSLSLKRVIMQGSIANSSRDNVVAPVIPATPPPTASTTPTPSVTNTVTPTVSPTPTQTSTVTPTPTITNTPTITPTITITPTTSITPTITPTISLTPTITPTITVTPSVTPDYSMFPLIPLTLNQDILVSGFPDFNYASPYEITTNFKYILNGLYRVTNLNELDELYDLYQTKILKYQNIVGDTYLQATSSLFESSSHTFEMFNSFISPDGIAASTPEDYGDMYSIPASGFDNLVTSAWAPRSYLQEIKLFNNLDKFVTTSPIVSTLILRGVTGFPFNNTYSSVNGLILQYDPDYRSYRSNNIFNNNLAELYFENFDHSIEPRNMWVLYAFNTDPENSYAYAWSGSNNLFNFGTSAWRAMGDFYEGTPELSSYAIQPSIQFLNATGLQGFVPPITPTPPLTPTPTITPTISLTPTITPTITITPSITPTITPTKSVTPTITPTITVTPTVSRSFDPDAIYTGTSTIYVRGISGTNPYDPAPELSGSYSFVAGITYVKDNPVGNNIYLSFNPFIWPEYISAWEFFALSDSGEFQRAYYPWSDSSIIPNTTGWIKGKSGYGSQEDYNYMVIGKGIITPTPTPTPTETPTTPTPTPSISITPSITPTISITPSITTSVTPTKSVTPTITPTITITPSITPTIPIPTIFYYGEGVEPFITYEDIINYHGYFPYSGITGVIVGSNVITIGSDAFLDQTDLQYVNFTNPDGLINLRSAFKNCSSLRSFTVPNNVLLIPVSAFTGCTSLSSVTIGRSVNRIREGAFGNCPSLTALYFLGNAPILSAGALGASTGTVYYCNTATGFTNPFPLSGGRASQSRVC